MAKVERKYDKDTARLVSATGKCEVCGRKIDFHFRNADSTGAVDCECGAIYNTSGQRLQPRDQWEEPIDED